MKDIIGKFVCDCDCNICRPMVVYTEIPAVILYTSKPNQAYKLQKFLYNDRYLILNNSSK